MVFELFFPLSIIPNSGTTSLNGIGRFALAATVSRELHLLAAAPFTLKSMGDLYAFLYC